MAIQAGGIIVESLVEGKHVQSGGAILEAMRVGEKAVVAGYIAEVMIVPLPPVDPPFNLRVSGVTDTGAVVMWEIPDVPEGSPATSYEWSIDGGVTVNGGLVYQVTLSGFQPNSTHAVRVRSVNDDGVSAWVEAAFTTTVGLPSPPISLVISSITATNATVDWSAPTSGAPVTSYEWSLNMSAPTSAGLTRTASLTGLTPGETYSIRVRSVGSLGASEWALATFTALSGPNPPINLLADSVEATSAHLSWDAPVGGTPVTSYEYSVNLGATVNVGLVEEIAFTALSPSRNYSIQVRSVGQYGVSNWVDVVFSTDVEAPGAPTNLKVTANEVNQVTFEWAPASAGGSPNDYQYALDSGAAVGVGLSTSVGITNLVPGSSHTFKVRASNAGGTSSWTTLAFEVNPGPPPIPANLRSLRVTQDSATVQWDIPNGDLEVVSYEYSFNFAEVINVASIRMLVFDNLKSGALFSFRVRSVGEFGTSAWSEISFTTELPDFVPVATRRLEWNRMGERLYEEGLDLGVLYLTDNTGVAWSGLVSIDENLDEGTEPFYVDGVKYFDSMIMGDYSASLRALTYPDEFLQFEGYGSIGEGIVADDQFSSTFGLSYRSQIGNDTEGEDMGYKLHLVYNLTASPDSKTHSTRSPGLSANEFGWTISGVPISYSGYRPTAHVVLDSRYMNRFILQGIEDILYGSETEAARLPSIQEIVTFITDYVFLVITDNEDGTWTATGPSEMISMIDATTFQITEANAVYLDADTYTIQSS